MRDDRMELEASAIHRAVWDDALPIDLFAGEARAMPEAARAALDRSIEVVRRRRQAGTLYDGRGGVADETIRELAVAGWWGLRASPAFGGAGASFADVARAITEMALVDPWVAGMMSTQAGIGPISSLEDVGTPEQKERLLRPLARGERLGAFAITEPATSSDWNRIATTARRDGDRLLLTGEKLFITNAAPGRTVSLLCRVQSRLEMLVVELPAREDERFQIVEYALRAPAHLRNVGLRFRELPVPAGNLLVPRAGDGRTIAHRALNHGRVAVAASAAGMLRRIAGVLIPWVQRRETFGAAIGTRDLVRRRLGRLAGRIVACDALSAWAAGLLDDGYRGELECVTAKVFASEAMVDATIQILLKTLGWRAFLPGSLLADSIHDLLAPTVYEGENEILTMRMVASLARAHGTRYLAPIRDAMLATGFERSERGPRALWAARGPLSTYAAWLAPRQARQLASRPRHVPTDDDGLTALAGHVLHGAALEISAMLRRGPEAVQHQARAHELARRVQDATAMLVVTRAAARQADATIADAARGMAMELGHALLGQRPSPHYLRLLTQVGAAIAEDRFAPLAGVERPAIAMEQRLPPPPALSA